MRAAVETLVGIAILAAAAAGVGYIVEAKRVHERAAEIARK